MRGYKIITILISSLLFSCSQNPDNNSDNHIIAFVDTIPISYSEVDHMIRQEIFDELNRIYLIRKVALEETLKNTLISLESKKYKITKSGLLDSIYLAGQKKFPLNKFIEVNQFDKGITTLERSFETYYINTLKGNEILLKRYNDFLLNKYIDSIKVLYNTKILLKPPVSPSISFKNQFVHYKGNLESKTTLLIISDFECGMCRKFNSIFDSLYIKYKDNIKFGFTSFGTYVTLSALAAECAAKQGKFWDMHDSLFFSGRLPDSTDILRIAQNININIEKFNSDFNENALKKDLENNFYNIMNSGIYATPTIIINSKLIFNSSSISEIEQILLQELQRQN